MSSREKILGAIRRNKPGNLSLPSLSSFKKEQDDLVSMFSQILTGIGGGCKEVMNYEEINASLLEQRKPHAHIINAVQQLSDCNVNDYIHASAQELAHTELFIVKGRIAVAENSAIWITEKDMGNRLLPFLCQRLVIVVEENDLVAGMHEAYDKIIIDEEGYGVFIAGPSKTADIEQSLVIGAHGPLALQVFIIRNQK
jgi:L-lactate dehydrogenase complex protein LldG